MPPISIADVKTVRAARPQAFIQSSIDEDGQTRSTSEVRDDRSDTLTQEDEGTLRKSRTPTSQNEAAVSFVARNNNDRSAIKHYIMKKGVNIKNGNSGEKAALVAKRDRFDQLKLWRIEKLDSLESRKNKKVSARNLFPDLYSEASEEAWLEKTFSAWLSADEKSAMRQPFNNTAGNTDHVANIRGQDDDEDQDDEESIPIKPEFPHADVASYFERPPQRAAAKSAIKSGHLRLSTTPEFEAKMDAYFAQEEATEASKSKRRVVKERGTKRAEDFASDSDSDYMQQPARKYAAVSPSEYFNAADQSDHEVDYFSAGGNMAKVVKRGWKWNRMGRLVIDPPLHGW